METNEAEKIYNKVKENSIGKEKKSSSGVWQLSKIKK